VHKHRNLLAHAPDRLHEEVSADYNDLIYAGSKPEIEAKRKAFIRKWRLKCRAVVDSLEEAGDKLFTFARIPKSQWKSIRTSNAIGRLHEEFKRRIKTQTVLPSAETAAMLFWALLASGQITMPKVDGWRSLNDKPSDHTIDLAAQSDNLVMLEIAPKSIPTQIATVPRSILQAGLTLPSCLASTSEPTLALISPHSSLDRKTPIRPTSTGRRDLRRPEPGRHSTHRTRTSAKRATSLKYAARLSITSVLTNLQRSSPHTGD